MTRGFITIATGKEMYFQLAENLLRSYRLFSKAPMSFAILTDQENEYTALFDHVVLFEKTERPYFDKFELLRLAPFDETIFIDADCLAYADLNGYWDYFAGADDFSAAGTNYPINSQQGLFQVEGIGSIRDRVAWKPDIHGGLYFIRKGQTCRQIYQDCQVIASSYDSFQWPDYCAPYADEPVLCLAMAANGCRAMDAAPENYGIPWEVTQMEVDIFTGKCRYATAWHTLVNQGMMIHWSVRYCKKPLYRFEAEKLHCMLRHHLSPGQDLNRLGLGDTLRYRLRLRLYCLQAADLAGRIVKKLKRLVKGRL